MNPVSTTALGTWQLQGIRCGLEKESLRVTKDGRLAATPHPLALGSALTHPHITTDFSESQVELITGVHAGAQECIDELRRIQQFTMQAIAATADEMLWVSSMPCGLPDDDAIPLGQYGTSNVGLAKTVYRMGLGYRYGRRMQTISGIHYNWSMPGVSDAQYFGLIRNFRRQAFLLLYLLGASPAVCSSFVAGREHRLQTLRDGTLYLPWATSLRMGRLGYQSDAQSALAVSYNSLQGYAVSLQDALTRPYPAYEAIGVQGPDGAWRQLATTLLQIENEFYGTIRPKRVIQPDERPLHALRERGVEYVEVRLLDLNPFEEVGTHAQALRLIDVFLLHCLSADSPPDTLQEIAEISRNQHRTAERGREPGLTLERNGQTVTLHAWAEEILHAMQPIAARLDAVHASDHWSAAVHGAVQALQQPDTLPSASVLQAIEQDHGGSFVAFAKARSATTQQAALHAPLNAYDRAALEQQCRESITQQAQTEASDRMPFEQYLQQYLAPHRLEASAR